MSDESTPQRESIPEPAATEHADSGDTSTGPEEEAAHEGASATDEKPRYASQAATGHPAPIAFEGGAGTPSDDGGGTTGRLEWAFLMLSVFFVLLLVSIPAVFFTGIDLVGGTDSDEAPSAQAGSEEAREIERLQLLQETRAEALTKLSAYGVADEAGAFRIPVERAMRLTLREQYAGANAGSPELPLAIPGGATPDATGDAP